MRSKQDESSERLWEVKSKMALGGRPEEEGGHTAIKLSLNHDVHRCLDKLMEKGENASKFTEKYLEGPCKTLDPGPACTVVSKIKQILDDELASAYRDGDYSKMQVLAEMRGRIQPEVDACGLSTKPKIPGNGKDQ
jgi:hypothetical protein